MDVRVKFLGGAQSVTGSKYLLELDDYKILIDCGLFQGLKELRLRNWEETPTDVEKIDAIILTHAHIDHTGYLPRIIKEGFNGPVYCTIATAQLLEIMLLDAAKLHEEEAAYARKKGYSKHENPQPLFDSKDAEAALGMIQPFPYRSVVTITDLLKIKFLDAGHILGSSIVNMIIRGDEQTKRIVFSGDLGRYDQPILHDPEPVSEADILFVESTYGNKNNPAENMLEKFANIVNEAMDKNGCLIIPAFAVGRTQNLLYLLREMMLQKMIPEIPVYIDSPMAINTTVVYKHCIDFHKLSMDRLTGESVFEYHNFKYYHSQDSSMNLNEVSGDAIIISASGMCTGGRILHHLYHRLPRKNDTLLFVGYQAEGTRGRNILEGDPEVRIFGIDVNVKCHIRYLNGLSAHADKSELLRWLGSFTSAPKMTFLVHGEMDSLTHFQQSITQEKGWNNVIIPNYLESFELFKAI